jgi:hypothetical protein
LQDWERNLAQVSSHVSILFPFIDVLFTATISSKWTAKLENRLLTP